MAVKKLWKSIVVEDKKLPPKYLGVDDAERTFARTGTAGSTVNCFARSPEQYDEHDFAACWRSNVENAHHNLETDSDDMDLSLRATPSSPDRGLSFGKTVCRNRVFFTTAHRAMGIGPETTRAGDSICVLFGSVTPCILRAVGGHFPAGGRVLLLWIDAGGGCSGYGSWDRQDESFRVAREVAGRVCEECGI